MTGPPSARSPADDEVASYYALTYRVFAWLAPYYDALAGSIVPPRHRAVDFAAAPAGARVLDVATGTGGLALAFAERGYRVVAIDLVDEMLAVARRKPGAERVEFEKMDATALAFPDASFDVTTISFGLHEMPLPIRQRVVAEMVRVTRPGGRLLVVDYALPRNRVWRRLVTGLVSTWERGGYRDFIARDPIALLERAGVHVEADARDRLDTVRLIRGTVGPRARPA